MDLLYYLGWIRPFVRKNFSPSSPFSPFLITVSSSVFFSVLLLFHKILDYTVLKLGRHSRFSFDFRSRGLFLEQFVLV